MGNEFVWCLGEAKPTVHPQFTMGHAAANSDGRYQRSRDLNARRADRPTEAGRHARSARKVVSADAILRAFNTWAFKREQPSDPQLMTRTVAESAARGEPVSFVLYWGKGPRANAGEPEVACLDYLATLARRVREVYPPGASIGLILTDTHAALNGHVQASIEQYFTEIGAEAMARGFSTQLLSELTASAEAAGVCHVDEGDAPDEVMLERLSGSAGKWYRGEGTAREGAIKYFQMNMIEKRAVEFAFPRSIFVTFNGSELRCLFPDNLPVFYMYSLRRGFSVKPWFLPANGADDLERVDPPDLA